MNNVDLEEYKSPLMYQVIPGIPGIYGASISLPKIDSSVENPIDLEKMREAHLIAKRLCCWGDATSEIMIRGLLAHGYEFGEHEFMAVKAYLERQGFKGV